MGDPLQKLEICAGYRPDKTGPDWIRHDARNHERINLACDVWELPTRLSTNLPLKEIYSKNFLEHLTMLEGKFFIRMCWNMLKDGGLLTLKVPNMDWIVNQYVEKKYDGPEQFLEWFFGGTGDEWWNLHKTMYNKDLLAQRLQEGGFDSFEFEIGVAGYTLSADARKRGG